ncbi:MAG: shikimate dehydrogenase [Candidatus Altiarchaeota archaeon]
MRLYCVVGHPVSHSMSPAMHNDAFKKLGMKFRYETADIGPERLREFMTTARFTYAGMNVTIPHKVAVIEYLDELSREAELIGAVNTVKCGDKMVGYNTDGIGCVRALCEEGVEVKGKSVLIVGSGGAGRAISFQLALEGACVTLSDRLMDKAEELSNEIKTKVGCDVGVADADACSLGEALKDADILINSTPVGMSPNVSESVIEAALLPNDIVVMDLVYNPLETKLLKIARERGCKTVEGVGMLVHQGAESFRIWLDVEPPVDVMRKAVLKGLNQV